MYLSAVVRGVILYYISQIAHIQWGKNIFDPLLILYVCPLTKKWSVCNFNGRFILKVTDRIIFFCSWGWRTIEINKYIHT